jgi:hypothetical protein
MIQASRSWTDIKRVSGEVRFFPSQDTMRVGGFGNLIALPLQRRARELSNSVFALMRVPKRPDGGSFTAPNIGRQSFNYRRPPQHVVDGIDFRGAPRRTGYDAIIREMLAAFRAGLGNLHRTIGGVSA